jgi:hypothetical protein
MEIIGYKKTREGKEVLIRDNNQDFYIDKKDGLHKIEETWKAFRIMSMKSFVFCDD